MQIIFAGITIRHRKPVHQNDHINLADRVTPTTAAKVTMAFDNFTRVDYITLEQGKDGWKVSKVETTYP